MFFSINCCNIESQQYEGKYTFLISLVFKISSNTKFIAVLPESKNLLSIPNSKGFNPLSFSLFIFSLLYNIYICAQTPT